jgi:Mrp family chromosome partitioning ATPase
VLAVDADPTGRGLTSALGLAGRAGYADLLALGEKAWNGHYDALRVQQEPSLDVLPLGSLDTPAITTPARTRRILQQLSKKADLIVINAPSLQDSAAALYWGSVAGAAVLVVEPDTPPSATAAEIDTLTHADVNLVGTVLVQPAGRVSLMRRWLAPSLNG